MIDQSLGSNRSTVLLELTRSYRRLNGAVSRRLIHEDPRISIEKVIVLIRQVLALIHVITLSHEHVLVALAKDLRLLAGQIIVGLRVHDAGVAVVWHLSLAFHVRLVRQKLVVLLRALDYLVTAVRLRVRYVYHGFVSALVSRVDVRVFLLEGTAIALR